MHCMPICDPVGENAHDNVWKEYYSTKKWFATLGKTLSSFFLRLDYPALRNRVIHLPLAADQIISGYHNVLKSDVMQSVL